jgi:hypothetical protein
MRRRTFDLLASATGLLLVVLLAVGGGLLIWGSSFVNSQVSTQLSAQKIVFPTTSNKEFKALPKADAAVMGQYAGQLMTNGAQARAYADNFIAYHLTLIGGGKTYSQLSAESLAKPTDAALATQVQLMFRGDTLRSMLLNAYAFWQIGRIMAIAAIVAFVGAGLMLIMSVLGFAHLRRAPPEAEVFSGSTTKAHATAA